MLAGGLAIVAVMLAGGAAPDPAPMQAADYAVFRNEVIVERPLAESWARIGDYCAIAEWLDVSCELASGEGDIGTVRVLNGTIIEPMVGRTATSYTYAQTAGSMQGRAYYGTLAAEAVSPSQTRLIYTITYNQSAIEPDALRASEFARLQFRFAEPLQRMKQLVEDD